MPASTGPISTKTLDIEVLHEFVGTDPALVRELLETFRSGAIETSRVLGEAVRTGRSNDAKDAAHKLKSSARMVGALPLGDLCEAMEDAGYGSRNEELQELLPRFHAEMIEVARALAHALAAIQAGPRKSARA